MSHVTVSKVTHYQNPNVREKLRNDQCDLPSYAPISSFIGGALSKKYNIALSHERNPLPPGFENLPAVRSTASPGLRR